MSEKRDDGGAGGDEDFAAMLEEFERAQPSEPQKRPRPGDMVRGRVVAIGGERVFVDLGGRSEASLEAADVTGPDGDLVVREGDTIEARVVAVERDGTVVLRRALGRGPEASAELESAFAHGIPVEGLVTAERKGGFDVQVAGLRAFCPISQIDARFVEDGSAYVGQRFQFRVTKYEGGRRPDVVVSRRQLLEEEARVRAAELRTRLEPGMVLDGVVTSLKPYGAFVDLGGLEGMIHVSELGFQRVAHPEEVLREGQAVSVQVIRIEKTDDPKRPERIALSMRALATDPWEELSATLGEGSRVSGKVVRIEAFGAFVEIAPGVEGLVHTSEIASDKPITHARQALSVGQRIEAQVLGVDLERRRISLSAKGARDAEEAEIAREASAQATAPRSLGTLGDLLAGSLPKKGS